ncbi:hypothetical protein LG651_14435 [Tamlana sp. 62-3]|uniref:DUF4129 domain-containing protein n=1 Tax=Neotamlana sargassicola TaxID=2883125 RepID=A0A9X1L5T6_9FLAO|nr:hypothetical protein [Tamlana sargassicola]MCB4809450.1 hypothetical protein [Tamlana sargassicola]
MNLFKLHTLIICVLMLHSFQPLFCSEIIQQPEQLRKFDEDFKSRYSSDKFNYEGEEIVGYTESGSGEYEAYNKEKVKTKIEEDSSSVSFNTQPLNLIFYIAIAFAVIFLAYILVNEGGSNLFTARKHKKVNFSEDITAENIESADIKSLIKNAENNNNFRLAIRYYYLLVLKQLSLKNFIKFEDDKTNSEYYNEILEKPFSDQFSYTSYLYTYIWYGEFPVNTAQYSKAKDNFETLLNTINK